jgi:hypothetical protein
MTDTHETDTNDLDARPDAHSDAQSPQPFLGELRAVYRAGLPFPTHSIDPSQAYQAVVITRLEQWNGKEWVLVHEIHP